MTTPGPGFKFYPPSGGTPAGASVVTWGVYTPTFDPLDNCTVGAAAPVGYWSRFQLDEDTSLWTVDVVDAVISVESLDVGDFDFSVSLPSPVPLSYAQQAAGQSVLRDEQTVFIGGLVLAVASSNVLRCRFGYTEAQTFSGLSLHAVVYEFADPPP